MFDMTFLVNIADKEMLAHARVNDPSIGPLVAVQSFRYRLERDNSPIAHEDIKAVKFLGYGKI